jgi:hypothetical protein
MPRFSVLIEVNRIGELAPACQALMADGLSPTLPVVPLVDGRNHGPILVKLDAGSLAEAEARVREILAGVEAEAFEVPDDGFEGSWRHRKA